MRDETPDLDLNLLGLSRQDWLSKVDEIVDEDGYIEPLGRRHNAIFLEKGDTLLVSFETLQGIQALSERGQPLGWDMVRDHGWSHLCLTSSGDTWFRDPAVYGFFDRLIDDGFFDEFDRVLFYGAGPCGYAAASFSVAAPGAHVLAIQPQATLDARLTEWDDRFADMRKFDFTQRYGYAPDMLDAAACAYVIYDPREQLDAMHAALFTRSNVQKHRMRFMGAALQTDMLEMETWAPALTAAAEGALTTERFAKLFRARRDHRPYLRNLLDALEHEKRAVLIKAICTNVVERIGGRRFQRTLRLTQRYRSTPIPIDQD
ncbi:MAG: phosphoadenosine phosphosulfate reductase [Pseudomonadota bacterium]